MRSAAVDERSLPAATAPHETRATSVLRPIVFGANDGLVVAEVELRSAGEPVDIPDWVGDEVTADPRYYNANLVAHPYREWT